MKCCFFKRQRSGNIESKLDYEIGVHMSAEKAKEARTLRLLLLGGGAAGKSTFLKQLKHIYVYKKGNVENEFDGVKIKQKILNNVLEIVISLSIRCKDFGYKVQPENENFFKEICLMNRDANRNDFDFTQVAPHICQLWTDSAIQKTFGRRSEYCLMDNAGYFLSDIDRIFDDNYIVTFNDYVHMRLPTTGVVNEEFVFNDIQEKNGNLTRFVITDVGGQRSERKKWINIFSDVIGVIYVIALSGYDQGLYENSDINRMWEGLQLFSDVFMRPVFSRTNVIVFLNKNDIFEKKIKQIPFNKSGKFSDYEGDEHNPEQVIEYIKNKLKERDSYRNRAIFFHVTQATNTDTVEIVFQCVQNSLLKKSFRNRGLL